jgi:hypothetical protein
MLLSTYVCTCCVTWPNRSLYKTKSIKEKIGKDCIILPVWKGVWSHCKWRPGENPIEMSGSNLCTPRNETTWVALLFQNRIIMFCLPISTFLYLRAIYIFPGSVCLFCWSQIARSILGIYKSLTDTWMQELGSRLRSFISGIHKSDFWYSAHALIVV